MLKLNQLAALRLSGQAPGITSVCSAHPLVLRSALRHGRENAQAVLIEATCNQVNHQGGYTGMLPEDFSNLVKNIAKEEGCPVEQIILGGDHLGPNPWRHQPAREAMAQAELMVEAYVLAGFRKIHLDASMGCQGEPAALDDETTAARVVQLAIIAEAAAKKIGGAPPLYVIGTEVPPPGGADHELSLIEPTSPDAARRTIEIHRALFGQAGLADAFSRVIGLVVQPGVEFGNQNVVRYVPQKAESLSKVLVNEPQFVFEAHSTDYQGNEILSQLVRDGFAILKVGPELTFVLREGLYALDLIASDMLTDYGDRPLYNLVEKVMTEQPKNWSGHYSGTDAEKRFLRHYSYSDRVRYYWGTPEIQEACDRLISALAGRKIPEPLMMQHAPEAMQFTSERFDPTEFLIWKVKQTLIEYDAA